jgi:zinc protease
MVGPLSTVSVCRRACLCVLGVAAVGFVLPPPIASAEPATGRVTAQKPHKKKPHKPKAGKHAAAGPYVAPAPPAAPEAAARKPAAPPLAIERLQLDNGLRVVLAPDHGSPAVSVAVIYDAGARNEERGSAGLAHLVEHLMFQGSANVLRGEHERLLGVRGGEASSHTESDRTAFVDIAPASELPLLLWLEADRMKSLQITTEAVAAQRDVLVAEHQRDVQGAPLGAARVRLRELVFQAFWPYEHDPRGLLADIGQLRPEAARAFYDAHYGASNAVVTVVGDFEIEHATQLVHRFFETARKQERPPAFDAPPQPEQTSQRMAVLEDAQLRAPAFLFGWPAPSGRTDDTYALSVALDVLAEGPASRLAQRLQTERTIASRIHPFAERQRGQDLLGLEVAVADEAQRAEAERLVEQELEALSKAGPTEAEMARFRGHAEAAAWRSQASFSDRALLLGKAELTHGDARLVEGELGRAFGVTRERVRAAVSRYMSPSHRTLVEVLPPRDGSDKGPPRAAAPRPAAWRGPAPPFRPAPPAPPAPKKPAKRPKPRAH